VTHLSQRVGFAIPHSDDVVGLERYDKVLAVATDRYFSPEGKGVSSEGLNDVKF
jgi:hypothetical protein